MMPTRFRPVLALVTLLFAANTLSAQPSSPDVGFVFPAGGRPGSTFQIKLGGQYLAGASGLYISGKGVTGKVLGYTRPLTQKEINDLRDRLDDLQKKDAKTDADRKEIEQIRVKIAAAAIRPTPVLEEVVTAEVTISSDAEPGPRDLRVVANTGMSGPIVFEVGQLPEIVRAKELFDPEAPTTSRKEEAAMRVTLPAVLNSQILPGQVDRYRFAARRGQHLVFVVHARSLTPYLADAVPGWFQAVLTLYDAEGNEVAFNDDFHNQPDPVLNYKVPKDGEFVLEIRDSIHRGREDFVYRIEAGELPFITNIFPLGGQVGTQTVVELEGWNLPASKQVLEGRDVKPGLFSLSVRQGNLVSNRVPFVGSQIADLREQEANNTPETAQMIRYPVVINGRIDQPNDWDVYQFQGSAGQTVVAEVWARRLGSPLDSILKWTDANGKELATNDDREDRGQGLMTHHADSFLQVTLPANGTYSLHIGDTQRHGSSAHAYRLRVSAPRPDFELRVTPCSINARPGDTVPVTVHAVRRDGFTGEINLGLTYTPVDFSVAAARIPANQDEIRFTLKVPGTAREKPVHLAIQGWALVPGGRLVRDAVPADERMQAFAYHHLVPANDLMVTISGRAQARFPAQLLERGPVKLRPGGEAVARLAIPRGSSTDALKFVLSEPPEGVTLRSTQVVNQVIVLQFAADAEKVKPGQRVNLIVAVYPDRKAAGATPRPPIGTLPAIPLEIFQPRR